MEFEELYLIKPLLKAISEEGYEEPTPIQVKAIPHLLDGRDLMGCAQTGTGKTAAFALPILQMLSNERPKGRRRPIRSLVLAPTRELATQIYKSFVTYGRYTKLRGVVIYGGVSQRPQADELAKGVDFVVATPGRLLDLMNQGLVSLDSVQTLVLDEGDRMLDMGFIVDIRKIIRKIPEKRQTLLFSATLPKDILRFANSILTNAVSVEVSPDMPTVELIDQKVYFVEWVHKMDLLKHLLKQQDFYRVLVFCETKHTVDWVEKELNWSDPAKKKSGGRRGGFRRAQAIHSGKSQRAREQALERFKRGEIQVLVATDIAARGIDVEEIDHVINFEFPKEPEVYIHRIGRTGRAGARGIAISFCTHQDRPMMRKIEMLIKQHLEVVEEHPFKSDIRPPQPTVIDPKIRAKNLAKARRLRRRK
jgi:ATP-dependent RNA helicase RhlE